MDELMQKWEKLMSKLINEQLNRKNQEMDKNDK